uniref:CCHC-type domain-containing protein n=1 Tax=Meloidogyne floridensis TaxID=298350 RepID=A0A915NL38_9BILA
MSAPTITQQEMLADSIKIYLNRQIPSALGQTATPNQLRRQLYYTKDTLDRLEETLKKFQEISERAANEISKMPQAQREQREAIWQASKGELGVRALKEAGKLKFEEWKNKKLDLCQRLDLQMNMDESTSEISEANRNTPAPAFHQKLQRPHIKLRRFNGNIEEWCSFWETYRVLIHEDPTLSHVEKFNILDSILEDEAKDLLGGLTMTHEGYDTAIDLLLEKFGSERKLVRSLNHELLNLPQSENFEDDEKLYLRIEKLCRQLQSLKQNVDTAPYFMTLEGKISSEVLDKYFTIKDEEDNEDWNTAKFRNALGRALAQIRNKREVKQPTKNVVRDKYKDEPTMNFAVNYSDRGSSKYFSPRVERPRVREEKDFNLRQEFTRRKQENYGSGNPFSNQRSQNSRRSRQERREGNSDRNRNSNSPESQSPSRFPCQLCDKPHTPLNCSSVRTAEKRKDKALERSLCFKCLRKRHYANECPYPRRSCLFCGKTDHHSALCKREFKEGSPERTTAGVSASAIHRDIISKEFVGGILNKTEEVKVFCANPCSSGSNKNSYEKPEPNTDLEPKELRPENSIFNVYPISKRVGSQNRGFAEIILKERPEAKLGKVKRSFIAYPKILKRSIKTIQEDDMSGKDKELIQEVNKEIPVRRKLSEYFSPDKKKRVSAQTIFEDSKKPLEATSPLVFICDERALELRNILRKEKLRGLVLEPFSWDSEIFSKQNLMTGRVDTLVVWKQTIDKGLLEVLKVANTLKVARKIIWIVPLEGIEVPSLKNITAIPEPEQIPSMLIKLATLGTPLITRGTKETHLKEGKHSSEAMFLETQRKRHPLGGKNKILNLYSESHSPPRQNKPKKYQLDGAIKNKCHREFYPSGQYNPIENYRGPKENRSGPKDNQCSLESLKYQYTPRTFYPSKYKSKELSLNPQNNVQKIRAILTNQDKIFGVRANNFIGKNMYVTRCAYGLVNCMQQNSWRLTTTQSGKDWLGEEIEN